MSDVKRYECLLIEDAPRLRAILPQGAVACSERTQMMVTAEDYAKLEAEAQALREEVAALRARVVVVPDSILPHRERSIVDPGFNEALRQVARLNGKAVSEGLLRRTLEFIKATNYQGSIPLGLIAELSELLGEGKEVGDVLVRE